MSRHQNTKPASKDADSRAGLAARQAASRLLAAVVDKATPLDGMIDAKGGNPAYLALSGQDRALTRAILSVSLRHLRTIDAILARLIEKPLPDGAKSLRHVLRVAAAQIVWLDVPDRAAVDLAVEQSRIDPRARRFSALTNAVLRRLSREKDALLAAVSGSTPLLPDWLHDRLVAAYGEDETKAIEAMIAEPAAIDLTVKSDPERWAQTLGGIVLPTGTVRLDTPDGSVADMPGFSEGEWWVQDAAASIPAQLFGDIAGCKVADLCAAPGGKTAQLANAGAMVTAYDISESRLRRLRENLDRLKLSADCVKADIFALPRDGQFDAVLLDAPCSSTGTMRRHPDIAWTKSPADITHLAGLQERLLRHAIGMVKPGGTLVFSNCSLVPTEGEDVAASVLADMPSVAIDPVRPDELGGLEAAVRPDGTVRTTPAMLAREPARMGGLDGFFALRLRISPA